MKFINGKIEVFSNHQQSQLSHREAVTAIKAISEEAVEGAQNRINYRKKIAGMLLS